MTTLVMTPAERAIVAQILHTHLPPGTKTLIFGSRATGPAKPYSDLDIAIDAGRPLTLSESSALAEAFTESDLPWKVDLVDRHTTTAAFWDRITASGAHL
jgi:predicted nucleotidyltransferase